MRDLLMVAYVLTWPVIVLVMMFVMGRGVWRDVRRARRRGEDLV
ncbi:putative transporter small subunit [Luteimonas sp. MC1750]|nr:putative transporter small subunit [Luteimonas sp. MC1750]